MQLLDGNSDAPERATFPTVAEPPLSPHSADILEYLRAARATGGPILDLGAGAGRFAVPLARLGFDVDAVDRDAPSLASLREWAGRRNVRPGRVTTVEAELNGLRLRRAYGLVMLAGDTALELPATARPALFREIAAHLREGGALALDYITARRPGLHSARPETASVLDDLRSTGLRIHRRDTRPLADGLESTFLLCGPRR
ncbi:class I SAM-dependent methyltransferase [Kitasatospora cathayae]|uniref:Class I SAM-dependent methyltransferase n=1 Tax=Kitasatospora cathayae TaxID=3004092 RepID=A0ABY7PXZ4_9ACTN|nr:class I SAM-dependent methyltransferase [Kitasatospora sp. HUAS 3-15]WBP85074.1 class I SAM-dependent methyltransferase [Kitasatospora sp. HUAS 3-15]